MAKFTPALLIFLLLTNMCCCGNSRIAQIEHEVQGENAAYSEMVDNIFEALDNNDKEGLKQLFSVNTIKNTPDLDAQIDDLFRFYQGPRERFDNHYLVQSEGHNEYGTQSVFLHTHFDMTAGGNQYYIYMSMDWRDDFVPDDEGIHIFDIANEEAANSEYYCSHPDSWGYAPGIYIQTSPEKREDVVWLMSKKMKYQYFDRELHEEDIVRFVEENGDSFSELFSYLGEPNANSGDEFYGKYYYELSDGRFGQIDIENARIKYICIANEERVIETLWSNPDEDLWH